jgi:cytochrome c oxidase subunit II
VSGRAAGARAAAGVALLALGVAACSGNPSALDPVGPSATRIAGLFWLMLVVAAAVWLLTVGAAAAAFWVGRGRGSPSLDETGERRRGRAVAAAVAATALILILFVGASFVTDRELLALERDPAVEIEVTAHQWWWEVRYLDPQPDRVFTTANEIHVPVGGTVKLHLHSTDVIHSFWLPNVGPKRDVIPGRDNVLWLRVDEPGTWLGRCSEFCGYQHAKMLITLVAEPEDAFERWRAEQAAPARPPSDPLARRGERVFASSPCVMCHVVRGSPASGYSASAPDLTHLASRRTIAAGAAPNEPGWLAGWIVDPQGLKPGAHMPPMLLAPDDLQALLAYLRGLR